MANRLQINDVDFLYVNVSFDMTKVDNFVRTRVVCAFELFLFC